MNFRPLTRFTKVKGLLSCYHISFLQLNEQYFNLSFAHEFAHIQTAPMLVVYMIVTFILIFLKDRTGAKEVLFLLVSIQAAWEIMSEGLVVLKDFAAYQASYKGITRLPRILFWGSVAILAAAGWVVVFHR